MGHERTRRGVIRMKILPSYFIRRTDGRSALKSIARDALHTRGYVEPESLGLRSTRVVSVLCEM